MEHYIARFEDIPSEVHAKIFEYLTTKELLRGVARASKDLARLVQDALIFTGAAPNSANILVTGMTQAGCTTLTARIKESFGLDNTLRNIASSSDIIKAVRIQDNINVFGVQLSSCIANLWHASTHPRKRKMMFQYYGINQLVVFVVPSQVTSSNKKDLKEALLALYSLAGHTNWIVVVNKMDLINYSETEYHNTVATVRECARKIIGQHTDQLTFVPACATETAKSVVSASDNLSWYTGPTLESELNARAVQYQVPAVKIVRKLNMSVVSVYRNLSQKSTNANESTVVMAVYVLDGLVRVGDAVEVFPPCSAEPFRNFYNNTGGKSWGYAKVLEIQYLAMSKQYALPNSYVGIKVQFRTFKFKPRYHHLQNVVIPVPGMPHVLGHHSFQGLFNATIVHVANKSNLKRKWDGLVKRGYSGGFATVTLRGLITVEHFKNIYDKDGNELNLDEVKAKRGGVAAIERGEKAQVVLRVWCPMPFVFKEPSSTYNYPDAYGRMIIYHDYSRVILVGVLHSAYTALPLSAQGFINDKNYLRAYKHTL
jgi:hypothetical protein